MNELPYFIFNNINSNDLGIIVKEMPPISRAEKNIEIITVNGRNGDLHIDSGTYKSKKYKIICILMDLTKIDDIKSIYDGTGKLELSSEPNREYQATIKNQIDFSKYLTYLKEFPLLFEVNPIAYGKILQEKEVTTSSVFIVGGNVNTFPIITITGIGTFTINNKQVTVLEDEITIDCDLMNCIKGNINKNDKVILDEFPFLVPGENIIDVGNGINSIKISYREGWK